MRRTTVPILLALLSGGLLFLSDHPLHWWGLQFTALAPLWLALVIGRRRGHRLFPLGALAALAYTGPLLFVAGFDAPIVVSVVASVAQWALLAPWLGRLLATSVDRGSVAGAFAVGGALALGELAVWTFVPMFGTAQCFARPLSGAPAAIAFVAFTGTSGLVFALATSQALLVLAVHGVARTKALVALVALVATIAGLDAVRWTREPGPTVRVAAFGWGGTHPATGSSLREAYDGAFRAAKAAGCALLVTPETGATVGRDRREVALEWLCSRAKEHALFAAIGVWHDPTRDNRIWFLGEDGGLRGEYRKSHLIPWLEDYVAGDGTIVATQLANGASLGGMICQDDNFTDLARAHGRLGVRLVAVPTNDWSAIRWFHLDSSILRAIENGYAVVRATSGGVSATITPRGEATVRDHVADDLPATVVGDVATGDGIPTVYARFGDWPVVALALLAIVLALRSRPPSSTPS
jgi:apolipoprotein N-acyltransferase